MAYSVQGGKEGTSGGQHRDRGNSLLGGRVGARSIGNDGRYEVRDEMCTEVRGQKGTEGAG
eukprot:1390049-Rhodomonas_salina.5